VIFRSCGRDVTIHPLARIIHPERIEIGDSVIIDDFVLLMGGSKTTIGSHVHLAAFSSYAGGGELTIGDFAGVSMGTRVFTGSDDFGGDGLTGPTIPAEFRAIQRSFVSIGRHAIVGANSVILAGVRIGDGAAIGAGSVVTRECEPWTVYAGVPARALRPRRRDKILELEKRLLAKSHSAAADPKTR
jgi:galactoside O-acetyltransferase